MNQVEAMIGLGSNLQNPIMQVNSAIKEIAQLPNCDFLARSSLYRSTPVGPQDQPDFINAVIKIATTLTPIALLDALQAIEREHGRVRTMHWGPRTLDCDILLFGDVQMETERLVLPHPHMNYREFVQVPLREVQQGIAPSTELQDLTHGEVCF